jgi:hypothetical protein
LQHPAVDEVGRAGHIVGVGRREEDGEPSNLFRTARFSGMLCTCFSSFSRLSIASWFIGVKMMPVPMLLTLIFSGAG